MFNLFVSYVSLSITLIPEKNSFVSKVTHLREKSRYSNMFCISVVVHAVRPLIVKYAIQSTSKKSKSRAVVFLEIVESIFLGR